MIKHIIVCLALGLAAAQPPSGPTKAVITLEDDAGSGAWLMMELNANGELDLNASNCVDTSNFCNGAQSARAACATTSGATKTGAGVVFRNPGSSEEAEIELWTDGVVKFSVSGGGCVDVSAGSLSSYDDVMGLILDHDGTMGAVVFDTSGATPSLKFHTVGVHSALQPTCYCASGTGTAATSTCTTYQQHHCSSCAAGYTADSNTGKTCVPDACASTEHANSDYAAKDSISGNYLDTPITVTCNPGYSSGATSQVTCQSSLTFTSAAACTPDACTPISVANSVSYTVANSLTGVTDQTVTVACNTGYTASGTTTCQSNGSFTAVTCDPDACAEKTFANSQFAVTALTGYSDEQYTVTCDIGYSGGGKTTCQASTSTFSDPTACTADACTVSDSGLAGTINCLNGGTATGTTGNCLCDCTNANGFTGTFCHECAAGKGFDGVDSCVACAKPQFNNEATHDATCADQACAEDYGHASAGSWTTTGTTDTGTNCAPCAAGYESAAGSGQCDASACTAAKIDNSQLYSGAGSLTGVTGDVKPITCATHYTPSAASATCQASGTFTTVTCDPDACTDADDCNDNGVASGNRATGCTCLCNGQHDGADCSSCHAGYEGSDCTASACTATSIANSASYSAANSLTGVTGDVKTITCNTNYSPSAASATCQSTGWFTTVTCDPDMCTNADDCNGNGVASGNRVTGCTCACNGQHDGSDCSTCKPGYEGSDCTASACTATLVANSDKSDANAITGTTGASVPVTCDSGYSGDSNAVCQTDGTFSTVTCVNVDECAAATNPCAVVNGVQPTCTNKDPNTDGMTHECGYWSATTWGDCDLACGTGGTQYGTRTCQDASGNAISADHCAGSTAVQQTCDMPACTWSQDAMVKSVTVEGGDWTTATCPSGYYIIGGGCEATSSPHTYTMNAPGTQQTTSNPSEGTTVQNNVWTCGGNNSNKKVTAICSRFTTIVREAYSTTDTTQVSCQPGENLIGGGCYDRTDSLGWHYSKPMFSPSTWTCDGAGSKKHARAICIADTTLRIDVASQDNPNSDYVPDWVAGPVCTSSQIMIGGGCASLSTPGNTNTQWWNNGFYGNSNFNNGYNCVDYESQGWCSAETGCTTHCDYQGVSNNGNNPNWDCSHCDTDQQKWHCAACGRPNGVATDNCALCSGNALIRNTFGGQRKLQMSGPANWKSADSASDMSVDTTGWLNHDTYQHPCSDYVSNGWCDATTKTFVPGQEGTGGSTYNNPELNCNACGKAESLNKRWLCGGHGSQKQVWTICASEPSNYVRPSAITNLLVGDDVRTDYTGY